MSKASQIILITGGTGLIGKPLCERLLQEGYSLYILTRQAKKHTTHAQPGMTFVSHLDEIQNVPIDMVINLAGETIAQRWTSGAKARIYKSRIDTTKALVEFMAAQSTPPKLFISASAVGYYGTHKDHTFTEQDVTPPTNSKFGQSLCQDWEQAALPAIDRGIRTVILRIAPVLAKDGGMLSKLLPSFRLCLGSYIGAGDQWLSWIERRDLIDLILFIIHNPNIEGPLNATAPNPVTNKEFSTFLAAALHRPCFLKTPQWVMRMLFGQMAEELLLNGQKVVPTKALDHGFEFSAPTVQQALSKIQP